MHFLLTLTELLVYLLITGYPIAVHSQPFVTQAFWLKDRHYYLVSNLSSEEIRVVGYDWTEVKEQPKIVTTHQLTKQESRIFDASSLPKRLRFSDDRQRHEVFSNGFIPIPTDVLQTDGGIDHSCSIWEGIVCEYSALGVKSGSIFEITLHLPLKDRPVQIPLIPTLLFRNSVCAELKWVMSDSLVVRRTRAHFDIGTGTSAHPKQHVVHLYYKAPIVDSRSFACFAVGDGLTRGIMVEPTRARACITKDFEKCWRQLRNSDPDLAYKSQWELIGAGNETVAFLKSKLRAAQPPDLQIVIQNINALESTSYRKRVLATHTLVKYGHCIHKCLQTKCDDRATTIEGKARILQIMKMLDTSVLSDDECHLLACLTILEQINTCESKILLQQLSVGFDDAFITRYAKTALARLGRIENAESGAFKHWGLKGVRA